MKILHIITGLSTGGAERSLYSLLEAGLAERFNSHVLSLSDEGTYGGAIHALGVQVHALNMKRGIPTPHVVRDLGRLTHGIMPDVIQGWMYHGNLAASLAGCLSAGHSSISWNVRHSLYGLQGEKFMTRQVIRVNRVLSHKPDAILYNSKLSRRQHEEFGFSHHRGRVISNGFDLQRLGPNRHKDGAVREALGIPASALVVGHVARLHPIKDHPLFMRTAARLAAELPDMHILACGSGVDYETAEVAQLVPEHLRPRFHLLGERSDVPDLMTAMDVFCQSSWSEAFPNVIGEAMASGTPCVVTDVGDSAAIVGETGIIVPPKDDDALFAGLMSLLRMPTLARCKLGQDGRARIEENFSLGAIVAEYSELYDGFLRQSR